MGGKDEAAKQKEKETKDLEKQEFFHGFRPRRDILKLVRQPGEYLVRVTDNRSPQMELVLTVMNDKKELIHLTLKFDKENGGHWGLGILKDRKKDNKKKVPQFPYVVDLINHYKENKLPGHAQLKTVVPRPNWLIKRDEISFDKDKDLLGSGNFCNVYKGLYETTAEKLVVAIKICHEGKSAKEFEDLREERNKMIAEAQLMSYYLHEHVIKFYGVSCDRPPVVIVMEHCPGGNLVSHLEKMGPKIEIGEKIQYAMDAARGMFYLHKHNCVHRDLAARNCLIAANGYIKIADFGMSKIIQDLDKKDEDEKDEVNPQIPIRWMAPETLKRPAKFSLKSDSWSFGVLIYEIFNNGGKPYPDEPNKKIATLIRKGVMPPMPETTPAEIKELVASIWVIEPDARPEMRTVCKKIHELTAVIKAPPVNNFALNSIPGVARQTQAVEETNEEDDTKNSQEAPAQREGSKSLKDEDDKSIVKPPVVPARRSVARK